MNVYGQFNYIQAQRIGLEPVFYGQQYVTEKRNEYTIECVISLVECF